MNRQFEYKSAMDSLRFTDEQKRQMAESAAQAAEAVQKENCRTARRPFGRIAVIAACAAVLLVMSAGATGALRPLADVFAPIFGGTAAQTEVIDRIGYPIGASDTDNGVTITADAIIGDKYNAAIVFTVRRDDGTRLLPEPVNEKNLLMGGAGGADLNMKGGSHGSTWIVDEDPEDDVLQIVQTISADRPISSCTATAEFNGLCAWDDEAETAVPAVEGHWKFRFDVDYEDSSVSLGSGETFEQDGMTFTIDEIRVSPVAVRVAYTADSEVQWSNAPSGRQDPEDARQVERYMENVEILLTKTDGTVVNCPSGGSLKPEHGITACVKGGVLEEIIPMDEIASISIGGIVYPISAE